MVRVWLSFLVMALVLVPCPSRAGTRTPTLVIGDHSAPVVLTGLPDVFSHEDIREELYSGLTNTILLQVTLDAGGGSTRRGGVAIDIRYELWDEIFLITVTEREGCSRHETIDSFDSLRKWWEELRLDILAPGTLAPQGEPAAEVEFSLMPFSQAEQRDAQVWLTRSARRRPSGHAGDDGSQPEQTVGDNNDRVLDILVATSIKRRSICRYRWTATIAEGRASEPTDDG